MRFFRLNHHHPYREYQVCVHNMFLNLCEFRDFIETQMDEIEMERGVTS